MVQNTIQIMAKQTTLIRWRAYKCPLTKMPNDFNGNFAIAILHTNFPAGSSDRTQSSLRRILPSPHLSCRTTLYAL